MNLVLRCFAIVFPKQFWKSLPRNSRFLDPKILEFRPRLTQKARLNPIHLHTLQYQQYDHNTINQHHQHEDKSCSERVLSGYGKKSHGKMNKRGVDSSQKIPQNPRQLPSR